MNRRLPPFDPEGLSQVAFLLSVCARMAGAPLVAILQQAGDDWVVWSIHGDDSLRPGQPMPEALLSRARLTPILCQDGTAFGKLCVIDAIEASTLDQFARLFALTIEQNRPGPPPDRLAQLAHDLRNPLAALAGGLRLLQKRRDDETLVPQMQEAITRMQAILSDLVDARNRP